MELWHKTPWMVRIFALLLVTAALVIIITKIVQATRSTALASMPLLAYTQPQVPVSYIYSYVDSLLRASQESAQNSELASKQGHTLEASAFAFAALAYLQSAISIAPKRVQSILPNAQEMIQQLNNLPSSQLKGKLGPLTDIKSKQPELQ